MLMIFYDKLDIHFYFTMLVILYSTIINTVMTKTRPIIRLDSWQYVCIIPVVQLRRMLILDLTLIKL
jgi:hypothetical protein